MEEIHVQSLPLHRPVILNKEHTLKEAALAMEHNQVGSVIVSDKQGILKGLITDRDLAMALGTEKVSSSSHLSEATEMPLIYVSENATLQEVIAVMKQYAIRRVPVVRTRTNGQQRCLGIITLDDLVRDSLISVEDESEILKNQLKAPKNIVSRARVKNIFHSQDQKEESLRLFLKKIEKGTGLDPVSAKTLTIHVLSVIFRRIPAKSSKNILSQLPYELQMHLISEIGQQDSTVTAKTFLNRFVKRYKMEESDARQVLYNFWQALGDALSLGETDKLKRQLPKDLAMLFVGAEVRGNILQ